MKCDLNCDLGEGEPPARTRALFGLITSANVACGGHAGNVVTMERCVELAAKNGVRLGAHPGLQGSFGRGVAALEPAELELLLLQQVGALSAIARGLGVTLHHVKLHGALYHATEESPALASRYVLAMKRWWPECRLYALAGGRVVRLAQSLSVAVAEEGFLDRGYLPNGTLVPRGQEGSLLTIREVRNRLGKWVEDGQILAVNGDPLTIRPATWCLHGDGREALKMAKLAREMLD